MPRKILIMSEFLVRGLWGILLGILLSLSVTSAQPMLPHTFPSRMTWSSQELASYCLDTTQFQKWIYNRDTLDRDSAEVFERMVQPSACGEGQEINTGGIGYPSLSLWWDPINGISPMNHLGIFSASMRQRKTFYFPKKPLTRIEFQAGGNNLQILKLNHHQQIGPSLSAGIQFQSITHNGFLQRSGSKIRNTDIYVIGSLRPGRHFIAATYQILSADLSENGGVSSQSLISASGYNPLNLDIQLRNANSKHQEERWNLENRWSWRAHQPQSPRLVHGLRKETQRWKFADESIANNLSFYPSASGLIDSSSSKDSLRQSTWTHKLGMEHQFAISHLVQYGIEFSQMNYYSGIILPAEHGNQNYALRSDLGLIAYGKWESLRHGLWMDWKQGLFHSFLPLRSSLELGWQATNYEESSDSARENNNQAQKGFLKSVVLEAYVDPPTYAQRWMKTNSTAWNLPELQAAQGLMLSSEWRPRGLPNNRWILRVGMMRNLIGLGIVTTDTLTLQGVARIRSLLMANNQETVAYLGLRARGIVQAGQIGRIQWFWNYHHLLQWSNNRAWIPLPLWACDDWLYVQRRTPAGWTWLAGMAVRYQTPFAAPHYRPELGMWTVAMTSAQGKLWNTLSGNYPLIDLIAGIRVQKTLLYIRWEHVNMGLPANIGQSLPGYPLGDRRLRFGLDWKFLD